MPGLAGAWRGRNSREGLPPSLSSVHSHPVADQTRPSLYHRPTPSTGDTIAPAHVPYTQRHSLIHPANEGHIDEPLGNLGVRPPASDVTGVVAVAAQGPQQDGF